MTGLWRVESCCSLARPPGWIYKVLLLFFFVNVTAKPVNLIMSRNSGHKESHWSRERKTSDIDPLLTPRNFVTTLTH